MPIASSIVILTTVAALGASPACKVMWVKLLPIQTSWHGGGGQHALALHTSGGSNCSSAREEGGGGGKEGRQEGQEGEGRACAREVSGRTPQMKGWRKGMRPEASV
eukprot:1158630-Pelagomonas_calceolata.AAC.3